MNSKTTRYTVLAMLSVIVICGLLVTILPHSLSATPPPYLNITRQQFNEALSKWNSHHIESYDLALREKSGAEWRLRVQGESLAVFTGSTEAYLTPITKADDWPGTDLRNFKVDALFARVNGLLEDVSSASATTANEGYAIYNIVQFHGELGYPVLIERKTWVRPGAVVSDLGIDEWRNLYVDSLTVR